MKHIIRQFKATARSHGFVPLVLIHADRNDLYHWMYMRPFLDFVRDEAGVRVVNVIGLFRREIDSGRVRRDQLYLKWHYSPLGHRLVARQLGRVLRQLGQR